ncbi:MAG: T9SS C-terminal target domain-containing protein [Bacteroidetes bacterium]|nr:MAG: T9SS C-terminal target domain-containing protein [Bacteroidota bacterium]
MRLGLLLLLIVTTGLLYAQTQTYHRARIHLNGQDIRALAALGLETDHGDYAPYKHLINDFSTRELAAVAAAGFTYDILIEDVISYYQNPRPQAEPRGGSDCAALQEPTFRYSVPSNFRLGDMAGFYRYQEMLDILDSMRLLYPNLISARALIGEFLTHQGQPLQWVRISSQPDTDVDNKPEILYTSLHHAREPNSLTQNIFFMWYLLENYATDPQVKFLVDHAELYFIPCINPDGYIFNETIDPEGGGLWRKNRRDNEDGSFGVDLNRNYGFEWGYDDQGSSPDPSRQTYRGPGPFSEPETQAVRDFCEAHEFVVALNYHTYGNLLIYPWGFSDTPTQDAPSFNALATAMTTYNAYTAGTGTETVGYVVNGDSDDWMYGENRTKPSILSMTPEVGSRASGFWPSIEEIIPNCMAAMDLNLIAANTPFVGVVGLDEPGQREIDRQTNEIVIQLQRYGLQDAPVTVSMSCVQEEFLQLSTLSKTLNLAANERRTERFPISFQAANIPPNTLLDFVITIDNGNFVRRDTIRRSYSGLLGTVQWADDFANLNNWVLEGGEEAWQVTDEDFVSPGTSLTDSPYSEYPNSAASFLRLAEPITVGEAEIYLLEFYAKWDIERGYDYVQLLFRVNDGAYIPACGRYTVLGTEDQAYEEPLWDGASDWVRERIDLTPYLQAGDELSFAFLLISDNFVTGDGYYVDDLELIQEVANPVSTTEPGDPILPIQVSPNPVYNGESIHLRFADQAAARGSWQLFHPSGKLMRAGQMEPGRAIPTENIPSGTYLLQLQAHGYQTITKKIIILK